MTRRPWMTVGRGEFEVYIAVTSVQRGERGFPIDKYILGGGIYAGQGYLLLVRTESGYQRLLIYSHNPGIPLGGSWIRITSVTRQPGMIARFDAIVPAKRTDVSSSFSGQLVPASFPALNPFRGLPVLFSCFDRFIPLFSVIQSCFI